MNWEAIAAAAELLGAFGVIASLLYLGTQVRNSRNQARQAAVQSVQAQVNSVLQSLSDNPQLASIYSRQLPGLAELEDISEVIQISGAYLRLVRSYEQLYHYRQAGVIDDWAWSSVHALVSGSAQSQGFRDWWDTRGAWFTDDFRRYMASAMGDQAVNTGRDYDRVRGLDSAVKRPLAAETTPNA